MIQFSIIGLNHSHQLSGYVDGEGRALQLFLAKVCNKYDFDVLAEELNPEAIAKWVGATGSVLQSFAKYRRTRHLFCDPNLAERCALNIPDEGNMKAKLGFGKVLTNDQAIELDRYQQKYWPAREHFWIDRIEDAGASRCLFLMGSNHLPGFVERAGERGHSTRIISAKWSEHDTLTQDAS